MRQSSTSCLIKHPSRHKLYWHGFQLNPVRRICQRHSFRTFLPSNLVVAPRAWRDFEGSAFQHCRSSTTTFPYWETQSFASESSDRTVTEHVGACEARMTAGEPATRLLHGATNAPRPARCRIAIDIRTSNTPPPPPPTSIERPGDGTVISRRDDPRREYNEATHTYQQCTSSHPPT
jgi:hypothetical protein